MRKYSYTQPSEAPPEAFVEQVKDALEHLYDLSYLQRHPLISMGIAGQRLRQMLAAAIEELNPGAGVPFHAPQARLYNLLRLRYVEGRTVRETAQELGLSLRQAHRDLRHAEESVAAILWTRRQELAQPEPGSARQISSLQAEMARLKANFRPTDISRLFRHALELVNPQAIRCSISFRVEAPPESVTLLTDPAMAEQVLVNVLSHAVQQSQPGTLFVILSAEQKQVTMTVRFPRGGEGSRAPLVTPVIAQMIDRLGWTMTQSDLDEDRMICIHMAAQGPTVLVIDDNEGLVALLERYLTDQSYRVIAAPDGQEGLRMATELIPDAIVLDVMMPEAHGWEVLQRLRHMPKTRHIPVIVCSIINNPELAYALGASLFLPKPVRRNAVLTALRQLGIM
ncbi:MAG: response regulator [Anaerolineae bacterium]|nr:response regulator [Anaerolineae bacterium]MDW8101107.1 response regulator [Anaerolineae bacterium]